MSGGYGEKSSRLSSATISVPARRCFKPLSELAARRHRDKATYRHGCPTVPGQFRPKRSLEELEVLAPFPFVHGAVEVGRVVFGDGGLGLADLMALHRQEHFDELVSERRLQGSVPFERGNRLLETNGQRGDPREA